MTTEIDWNEEIQGFDAKLANFESRIMWGKLAYMFRDVALSFSDFLETPKAADEAMAWAARAESCMWRATGDADSIDCDRFIPELRAPTTGDAA